MSIKVKRQRLRLGLIYGMVAGLAFALLTWGLDAWLLVRANATYPWVKFIPGVIICIISGGLAGWLTMLFEKHGMALLFWGLLSVPYSWLVVWLPLTGASSMIKILDPDLAAWFDFSIVQDLNQFRWVSLVLIGSMAIITGMLEINLIHQAVVSSNPSTSVMIMLVSLVIFCIAGSAADSMINTNLREPVQVVNNLIQFAADNEGLEVPIQTARKMHLSAANQIHGLIQKQRDLTLTGYDAALGMMDILVDFEGSLVKCSVIYGQPTDCIILTSNP
ncbi:MAG: hypothetical protein A2030_06725 [Chloroflexi bacterium RBG_19FT_COMBO_50_10]|nr:MAG: hypothetical protein A2030_06725 [Chloroflexi bacterium RBG_19FT_COMBO_50_10]